MAIPINRPDQTRLNRIREILEHAHRGIKHLSFQSHELKLLHNEVLRTLQNYAVIIGKRLKDNEAGI